MKYHGYELRKILDDGIDDGGNAWYYEIYKNGKYVNCTLTLDSAKAFVDSGEKECYLC